MKISTKGRYGLEALVTMCIQSGKSPISLKKIAESCNISEAYILQIFLVLRRSGIVESVRGAQGGYILSRDPDQITVGEVLNCLEGPISPVACILVGNKKPCEMAEKCSTRHLWKRISTELTDLARSITLTDLVRYYRNSNKDTLEYEDYCI